MSIYDWLGNTKERLEREGISGLVQSLSPLYHGSWRIVGSRLPLGTNVYGQEWDVLILLDGCRVDLLDEVADDYPCLGECNSIRSVASTSREWLAKTFSSSQRDEVASTVYVTANPHTREVLGSDSEASTRSPFNPMNWDRLKKSDFLHIDEVWADGWDEDSGTVPPRAVTDRAIHAARSMQSERLIVHYMQPHQPFIGATQSKSDGAWIEGNCWHALRRGDVSLDELWAAYRATLDLVLEDVELLLESIDADSVVISSDHGNAVGEWGIYGHPNGCLHPSVKRVPWVETTATNTGEYDPDVERDAVNTGVSEQLESLGYL